MYSNLPLKQITYRINIILQTGTYPDFKNILQPLLYTKLVIHKIIVVTNVLLY